LLVSLSAFFFHGMYRSLLDLMEHQKIECIKHSLIFVHADFPSFLFAILAIHEVQGQHRSCYGYRIYDPQSVFLV
jgi:hypothetical protein